MQRTSRHRGRTQHTGTPIDEVIARLGLGGSIVHCLQKVLVDEKPLTAMTKTQRTPNPYDPRPETKYGEAFAAAVAVCSMGLTQVKISTLVDGKPREAPDLELHAESQDSVGVEVVRVDETAGARVRLYEVQERVVTMLQRHPKLKSNRNLRFTLDYAKTGTLTAGDVAQLADELCAFFQEERWKMLPPGHCTSAFQSGTAAERCGLVVEVERPTYTTFLGFARADEMTPYDAIMTAIGVKRKLKYLSEHPLWLVVEVADPRGPFKKALVAVKDARPEIAPFVRLLVHDGSGEVISLPA